MAWFKRKNSESDAADAEGDGPQTPAAATEVDEYGRPSTPVAPIEDNERERIAECLTELAESGVDVDDLSSLSQGLDAAYRSWSQAREQDHSSIVRRYAIGVGEHLSRHTDLDWAMVSDIFGTDLGLAEGPRGAFVVVPGNIVASRWMRGETQWIPDVVGHLVRRRER
ncbi:MAG: glycosyltransferase [Ornithinimicrobium sp.]